MSPAEVRDLFERVREQVADLERLRKRAEAVRSMGPHPPTGRGGGPSDPTARVALTLADIAEETREVELDLSRALEWCGAVCGGVRLALGGLHADVLLDYYARCLPWEMVAEANSVSVRHAMRVRDTAIEWVAEVGPSRAIEGLGRAED